MAYAKKGLFPTRTTGWIINCVDELPFSTLSFIKYSVKAKNLKLRLEAETFESKVYYSRIQSWGLLMKSPTLVELVNNLLTISPIRPELQHTDRSLCKYKQILCLCYAGLKLTNATFCLHIGSFYFSCFINSSYILNKLLIKFSFFHSTIIFETKVEFSENYFLPIKFLS